MKKALLITSDNAQIPSFGYKIKKALEKHNYKVHTFNYRQFQLHRTNLTNNFLNNQLLKKALLLKPDFVLVNKGESINKGIIKRISQRGIKTINWCLDDPFGELNSFNNIKNRNEYDYFFVFDPYYVRKLKKTGQKNAFYLPCAVDPDIHREMTLMEKREYRHNVSFVGTYQKNREELLKKIKEYNPSIWGYHWNKTKGLNIQKEKLHGNKKIKDNNRMCEIFNTSKINLNIHYPHSRESVNLRTFDVLATKSFLLCDYFEELPNLFEIDKEIVCYKDVKELRKKIEYYLENEDERNKIIEAGYKRVLKEHTFYHRMKAILDTIS